MLFFSLKNAGFSVSKLESSNISQPRCDRSGGDKGVGNGPARAENTEIPVILLDLYHFLIQSFLSNSKFVARATADRCRPDYSGVQQSLGAGKHDRTLAPPRNNPYYSSVLCDKKGKPRDLFPRLIH